MNVEIIAVGSELLLGQIANTNAQYLSKELAHLGVNVYYHTVVGDNENRLRSVVKEAQKRANLILFTGGLGPTKDDLTKETIASMMGKKLVFDDVAMKQIEDYFKRTNRRMSENNKKQALVIEGSTVLPNDTGMAPGMAVESEKILYMLFPGPPSELKPMFDRYGRSVIMNLLDEKEQIESRVLRFFGIGESQLETDIIDLIDEQTNPTIAPLAGNGEVTLRLTAKHQSEDRINEMLDELEQKIMERVGEFFYGYDQTSLSEVVFRRLRKANISIASAESLTGGLFTELLTKNAGASEVVKGGVICYTNEIKENILGVDGKLLRENGAVSKECAKQLAENVREKFKASIGISFTGVAGPAESEGKPVGTVYIGIAVANKQTEVFQLSLAGSRENIRQRSVKYGCFYLSKILNDIKN